MGLLERGQPQPLRGEEAAGQRLAPAGRDTSCGHGCTDWIRRARGPPSRGYSRRLLSVVVPAFNEARALPATLAAIEAARARCREQSELVVVDNASTDATAGVARSAGARVVPEQLRNVARARNAGAAAAGGDILVFVDADTWLPPAALDRIAEAMRDPRCLGGALDLDQRPRRLLLRAYLAVWRVIGLALGMSQGGMQFCRREAWDALGGYDERLWMGEDVEFQWRLRRLARRRGGARRVIRDCRAVPSPRRWDQWPLWRTLIWTSPPAVTALARSRRFWRRGWYETPPR